MARFAFAAALVVLTSGRTWADGPPADGRNVLVVYQSDDDDRDRDKTPDGEQAAKYYAARRNVPAENLLGLPLKANRAVPGRWEYPDFFNLILKPVVAKLEGKTAAGKPFAQEILYILTIPGVPAAVDTHHAAEKDSKDWFAKTRMRSVDQYLISAEANLKAGFDEKEGSPGKGMAGPLGAAQRELVLPIFGAYSRSDQSFLKLREAKPETFNFRLVTRLGVDLASARDMLDGALYAERFLRLPGAEEKATTRPAIWLDQKYGFAQDHVKAMSRAVLIVHGAPGAPFAAGKGLQQVWPLVIDNQLPEIGLEAAGVPHMPTVVATIEAMDADGVTLQPGPGAKLPGDSSPVVYFPAGGRVTNGNVQATIVGGQVAKNKLLLDSTKGFNVGDGLTWTWPGKFPATDCFIFYGFYGLGQYEDVFRFLPGSLGVHVDSSCMNWANGAIRRGIAATFGVTTEPLSAGIPYGDLLLMGLGAGQNWADSAYGALLLSQRWAGVTFGDPIYAPFRSRQLADGQPPVLGPVTFKPGSGGVTLVSAGLAGKTEDELADVALFKLEYGLTDAYGQVVDFFDWPDPEKSKGVKGRRFGYSRHFSARLAGLEKGKTYHYRLTARDPAGLESQTPDGTFTP